MLQLQCSHLTLTNMIFIELFEDLICYKYNLQKFIVCLLDQLYYVHQFIITDRGHIHHLNIAEMKYY